MLPIEILSAGALTDAQSLTFLKPRESYEIAFLLKPHNEGVLAVILGDGDHKFSCWNVTSSIPHAGLLIPDVSIMVDPDSVFDSAQTTGKLGSFVRRGTQAGIMVRPEGMMRGMQFLPLIDGLRDNTGGLEVGFSTWELMVGSGQERQPLFSVRLASQVAN